MTPSVTLQDTLDLLNKESFDQVPVVDESGSVLVTDCVRERERAGDGRGEEGGGGSREREREGGCICV